MSLPIIALHRAHNASLAVWHNADILEVVELERFVGRKNASFDSFEPIHSVDMVLPEVARYLTEKYGFTRYAKFICIERNEIPESYRQAFPADEYLAEPSTHHVAHACNSLYQSPFAAALIVSFDGGGPDGYFNVYVGERGHPLKKLAEFSIDLGSHYHVIGALCEDIRNYHVLTAAGKVLGLQSYGKVVEAWKQPLRDFFLSPIPYFFDLDEKIHRLSDNVGLTFSKQNPLRGEHSFNLARTAQEVFEEITFERLDPLVREANLPLIVTGGCAMNIVFNTHLKARYHREVFVAPNSSDCGLAVGAILRHTQPTHPVDVTYKGIGVLDRSLLAEYVEQRRGIKADLKKIADDLVRNCIIGVVQGRSEHGPRALGNRSIICSPLDVNMKDTLNARVKHREWFRPFAPIVRLCDVEEYFEWPGESRWMNFCPNVREGHKKTLPAVTHVDGTARVQTVTNEQNPFMYDLLGKFKERTGVGVLVNTSFNVDGKPILSTYRDAFKVFDDTQLDRLYLDGFYFSK